MTLTCLTRSDRRPKAARRLAGIAVILTLAGCAAGPRYHRPEVTTPTAYKEAAGWKTATPAEGVARGPWWEVFGDAELNQLEAQVADSNQTLAQARADYQQARQLARADRATLFPTLTLGASAQRARSASAAGIPPANSFNTSLQAGWEPDFWGRIRRTVQAGVATAQASAADVALVRLSLQAELAQDYIGLRTLDERRRLLRDAVTAYRRTLVISQNRYRAGVTARSDVVSAQTQLDLARAQLVDVGVQRAQLEHAIAVLVGKAPSQLTIKPKARLELTMPDIPIQIPSSLLERRPDIAEAERQVAAANARVGVESAAWFPAITLSASGGFQGSELARLFTVPNRFWSLGAQAAETLLDWGARSANVRAARAAYEASVANYRQTVLSAFQNVEDNLSSLRVLGEEAKIQDSAVAEAAEAARITVNEYNAGTVDYTTVAAAQVAELNSRLSALAIHSDRLAASVGLITALGGGWSAADLPDAHGVFSGGKHG